MTSGANSRTLGRLLIVAAVALVFAGCTAMLAGGESALLIDFGR
jgi:hypothetical protein